MFGGINVWQKLIDKCLGEKVWKIGALCNTVLHVYVSLVWRDCVHSPNFPLPNIPAKRYVSM